MLTSISRNHALTESQGIRLLNLPLEAGEGEVTLKEASQEMFSTNVQADRFMGKMGLTLSNYEARTILQRRVEANDLA